MEKTEEIPSDLEDKTVEIIQSERQREIRLRTEQTRRAVGPDKTHLCPSPRRRGERVGLKKYLKK